MSCTWFLPTATLTTSGDNVEHSLERSRKALIGRRVRWRSSQFEPKLFQRTKRIKREHDQLTKSYQFIAISFGCQASVIDRAETSAAGATIVTIYELAVEPSGCAKNHALGLRQTKRVLLAASLAGRPSPKMNEIKATSEP